MVYCEARVKKVFEELEQVAEAEVSHGSGTCSFLFYVLRVSFVFFWTFKKVSYKTYGRSKQKIHKDRHQSIFAT